MNNSQFEILSGIAPELGVVAQYETLLSMIVLLLVGGYRFNTWVGGKFETTRENPPRHFTTFSNYVWYAFLYIVAIEITYLVLIVTPDLFNMVAGYFKIPLDFGETGAGFKDNIQLVLLFFLVVVVPKTPGLQKLEHILRTKLHRQAFIPAEAEALINQFVIHPARFKPDPKETKEVIKAIYEDIPITDDIMRPDKRLRHFWFKASYLNKKINEWKDQREIVQFYKFCEPILKNCQREYKELKFDIKTHYNSLKQVSESGSLEDKEYLLSKKDDLHKRLDNLLEQAYHVICCGVLATQRTDQGRMVEFQKFGLEPDFSSGPQIYFDIILSCIAVTTVLTFSLTYLYSCINPDIIKGMPTVISWTIIALFLQGASIFCAVLLYRRLSLKSRTGSVEGNMNMVFGPVTDIGLGACIGYLNGFVIIAMYVLLFSSNPFDSFFELFARIWSWPIITATTAGFVIYYLYSLDVDRGRIREGMLQGACMCAAGTIAYLIAAGMKGNVPNLFFLSYCAIQNAFTGMAIGYIFPAEYRKRKRSEAKINRRQQERVYINSRGTLVAGDTEYQCQTLDISMEGAQLATATREKSGTEVHLKIDDIGSIPGVIRRRDEDKTYLQLFPTNKIKRRLENYIGVYSPHSTG